MSANALALSRYRQMRDAEKQNKKQCAMHACMQNAHSIEHCNVHARYGRAGGPFLLITFAQFSKRRIVQSQFQNLFRYQSCDVVYD